MPDKLDLLMSRMNELEPKLDGLMEALRQYVQSEIEARVATEVAAQLGKTDRQVVEDGNL